MIGRADSLAQHAHQEHRSAVRRSVALGLLGSVFFSITFIVNRAIGLAGGHWIWTAVLRYAWVLVMLGAWFLARGRMRDVVRAFRHHWLFWTVAGTIGYGAFYASLTMASTRAPGWIVACTMQSTILVTPLVLLAFGRRVRHTGLALLLVIFAGIVLVNLDHRGETTLADALGVLPVIIAAFAYPIGNQLVQEASHGGHGRIPALHDGITRDASARVLLLTIGSVPFWLLLLLAPHPAIPTSQQLLGSFVVALTGTVIGTSIFLFARQGAGQDANAIAKVDATQAGYTAFSLAGEVLLLNAALPGPLGFAGLVLVLGGLAVYASTAH